MPSNENRLIVKNLQKIGGIAALGHTAALVVGMVLTFTVMFSLLDAASDQTMNFLADNQPLVFLWNLIVNWVAAVTLVIMLLAIYGRFTPSSPMLMRVTLVFGVMWAGLTIGAGNLMLHNFGVVANLSGNFPAQAAAWTALVRGVWMLLLSLAVVRAGGFPERLAT